jgi:iron(III) transport system permease protein
MRRARLDPRRQTRFCLCHSLSHSPQSRGGSLLVIMETIADFGTVAHFSVQTYARGIYTNWFGIADRGAAAQLALGLLAFALLVALLEYINRGSARYSVKEC